jgi:hypothetical protein
MIPWRRSRRTSTRSSGLTTWSSAGTGSPGTSPVRGERVAGSGGATRPARGPRPRPRFPPLGEDYENDDESDDFAIGTVYSCNRNRDRLPLQDWDE